MKKYFCSFIISHLCLTGLIFAQVAPFPQNLMYPHGFMPKTLLSLQVKSAYDKWKRTILLECNGGYRIDCVGESAGETKVEGMGFGMMLTVYMADKTAFDGLVKFYESKAGGGGMMAWRTTCDGISDAGSATDGDVEVAFALVIASWQWPDGGYADKAKKVIANLKKVVVKCNNDLALAGGMSGNNAWGGCSETDISYYNPAAFREFAKLSGDSSWTTLANSTYTILNAAADKTTGLVPDWQTVSGSAGGGSREANYKYDACRAPWRIAIDYLWNGNEKALAWCKKITDWSYKIGPKNIKDGYSLSGEVLGTFHNLCFTGGFGVAAMCHSQEASDAFAKEMATVSTYETGWFTLSVGLCNMMVMIGSQWRPDIITKPGVLDRRKTISGCDRGIEWKMSGNRELVVYNVNSGSSVALSDPSGRLVRAAQVEGAQSAVRLDASSIPAGVYILGVKNAGRSAGNGAVISVY
jgi:endoglucanase